GCAGSKKGIADQTILIRQLLNQILSLPKPLFPFMMLLRQPISINHVPIYPSRFRLIRSIGKEQDRFPPTIQPILMMRFSTRWIDHCKRPYILKMLREPSDAFGQDVRTTIANEQFPRF